MAYLVTQMKRLIKEQMIDQDIRVKKQLSVIPTVFFQVLCWISFCFSLNL